MLRPTIGAQTTRRSRWVRPCRAATHTRRVGRQKAERPALRSRKAAGSPQRASLPLLHLFPPAGRPSPLRSKTKPTPLEREFMVHIRLLCRELLLLTAALRFHITQESPKRVTGHQHTASNADDI